MTAENTTEIRRFTATVRAERRRRTRDGDRIVSTTEDVEAQVEITLNMHDIAWDLGASAIQNGDGKAGKMGGAIKAKILSETIVNTRQSAW